MEKRGKYRINVCLGTPCYVRNAEALVREFSKELNVEAKKTTEDGLFTVDAVRCVGACGLAPVVMVNDKVFGRVTPADCKKIVEEHMQKDGASGKEVS
jgi:NADH:ubiquinone oxidoreductase subunit E